MQIFFYCTPQDLQEIFSEIELARPLVYEPRFEAPPRIMEIDVPLCEPLSTCREFLEFGKAYDYTPPFYIYTPEDESRRVSLPILLNFSGSPSSLTDPRVLCEGSLFLDPENREEKPRVLYKTIRKVFSKRFVKSGYCFISPHIYANRKEYLFIQRDHNFLAPAWYFDNADQHTPIDIDAWYQAQGKRREQYAPPSGRILFFAVQEDLKTILLELEAAYDLKYVEVVRQGKGRYQETVFDTVDALMDAGPSHSGRRELYIYERAHRMLLYLGMDSSWNRNGRIASASEALALQNAFGRKLYQDFVEKVKTRFPEIKEPRYGPFYISPLLYPRRRTIVLSLHDPYFRVNEHDEAVHIWRREWNELLAQWGLTDEQN